MIKIYGYLLVLASFAFSSFPCYGDNVPSLMEAQLDSGRKFEVVGEQDYFSFMDQFANEPLGMFGGFNLRIKRRALRFHVRQRISSIVDHLMTTQRVQAPTRRELENARLIYSDHDLSSILVGATEVELLSEYRPDERLLAHIQNVANKPHKVLSRDQFDQLGMLGINYFFESIQNGLFDNLSMEFSSESDSQDFNKILDIISDIFIRDAEVFKLPHHEQSSHKIIESISQRKKAYQLINETVKRFDISAKLAHLSRNHGRVLKSEAQVFDFLGTIKEKLIIHILTNMDKFIDMMFVRGQNYLLNFNEEIKNYEQRVIDYRAAIKSIGKAFDLRNNFYQSADLEFVYESGECQTCFEESSPDQPSYQLFQCKHRYCQNCADNFISAMKSQGTTALCPWDNCGACLNFECAYNIGLISSLDVYKMQYYIVLDQVKASKYNSIACKFPNCLGVHRLKDDRRTRYNCEICNHNQCKNCAHDHNDTTSCTGYEEFLRHKDDPLMLQIKKGLVKLCPNKSCKIPISKESGCLHMMCKQCGHEFRWDNLRPWKDGMDYYVDDRGYRINRKIDAGKEKITHYQ